MSSPDVRPNLLNMGTALAMATVVVASVSGGLLGASPNKAALLGCAAAYLLVAIVGGSFVERTQRGQLALLGALLVLGGAAIWVSHASSILILMPLISLAVIYRSLGFALLLTVVLTLWISFVLVRSAAGMGTVLDGAASFLAAAVFVVIFSRLVVREREASARIERLAADLDAKNQQLGAYAAQVEELATTQERNRIAREIHDGLGHYLSCAHMQLEAARVVIVKGEASAGEHVVRAQELLREGLGEVRRSVAMLRTSTSDRPFEVALAGLIEESCASGVATELSVEGTARPLGSAIEFVLYRAAQEALTNVRRHARAAKAALRVRYDSDHVELEVQDDGVGAVNREPGFGLIGVRERAELVGGRVEIATDPSGGFALRVRVPV